MTASGNPLLTLGPVLFNWQADVWRDFYFRIADEAPVDAVYVGEAICSKRAPLFARHRDAVTARLVRSGKEVVASGLAQVVQQVDRTLVAAVAAVEGMIEVNDASALDRLRGRPHHIGPFMNVYNERTLTFLARRGARNFCLPPEVPRRVVGALAAAARANDATVEVQVFGRLPLALSARCYHARAHGRTRDSCRFVCEDDPDGLDIETLDGQRFLAINGIQTLSYEYLNLAQQIDDLRALGVTRFRMSPHTCDMVVVAEILRDVLDGRIEGAEATVRLTGLGLNAPFCNGFYHGIAGAAFVGDP